MQVYEISIFFKKYLPENCGKTAPKYGKAVANSAYCTKMTALIWRLTKTKEKNFRNILTFPYIYGKISRLNARRSERLLRCLTAMVLVGNFRGAR